MNNTNRVFVTVHGGYVRNVDIPTIVDGTHTVVDFDDAEIDAADVWARLDPVDRAYTRENCPDLCATYFAEFV
jgi:hypothetical protein